MAVIPSLGQVQLCGHGGVLPPSLSFVEGHWLKDMPSSRSRISHVCILWVESGVLTETSCCAREVEVGLLLSIQAALQWAQATRKEPNQ